MNLVWNHCNGAQRHALKHNSKWPTTGQLQRLTAGAGRLISAQRANKARRVAAIHAKIANTRKHFLHKETTKIADAFGLICVGNVSGRWLQASNGEPAADASTGMSRNMLRYKAMARAARFVDVSEYLTTPDLSRLPGSRRTERHEGSRNKRMGLRLLRRGS